MRKFIRSARIPLGKHRRLLAILLLFLVVAPLIMVTGCYAAIKPYEKFVLSEDEIKHTEVGLVLGAGVTKDGKPFKELQARLDSAAEAFNKGIVTTLLLSGDNRFHDYNEPAAMKRYLIEEKKLPADKLVVDYAGRSTYESCERASKVFMVKEVIIFSAGSHLPRAIYLCRHFSINAYGIANGVEANNSTRRELLARVKAVYNVQLMGERTVLGDPIPLR